jgi:hypothetical protein
MKYYYVKERKEEEKFVENNLEYTIFKQKRDNHYSKYSQSKSSMNKTVSTSEMTNPLKKN